MPLTRDFPDSRRLVVIGAGDHARVLLDTLALTHPGQVELITDNKPELWGQQVAGVPIAGGDNCIATRDPANVILVNGVGSVRQLDARRGVYTRFKDRGFDFLTVVHPSAVIARDVILEEGAQILAGAVIQPGVRVGRDSIVNTSASVDHDCVIGEHAHIAPGATLSGSVDVGHTAHIGTGATVIQAIHIGENALIGAGSVVVRDVQTNMTVMGVPARPISINHESEHASSRSFQYDQAFNVMVSAAGRRVALVKLLKRSLRDLNLDGRILATDISRTSSAFQMADAGRLVPNYADPRCLDEMLDLCREFRIRLIVPTIDPDLPFYARHLEAFREIGTEVWVSDPPTISIANDKVNTHRWLVENGFPTVEQISAHDLLEDMGSWEFPLFVKPRAGSSSRGACIVRSRDELAMATAHTNCIVQTVAPGREYTVDVYVDRHGCCRCQVPRLRLEIREGEVSKGVTVHHARIEQLARDVSEALPHARGIMNIQIFYDDQRDKLNVSEINPRFGGGYPLSHEAGAPMARWMIEEALGRDPQIDNQWQGDLVMLRWDDAVFVPRATAGLAHPIPRALSDAGSRP